MPIEVLSPRLASQIAAGEVVERPASVLKELLENSVDAGATEIRVTTCRSGSGLIRVTDNGEGIPEEDVPKALLPHATSKIHTLDDLAAIETLGFRGEALASIASVSRLSLTSCAKGAAHAFKVSVEGREMHSNVVPAAHPQGTTLDVRDLFFNVPARRQFLRSPRTEYLHLDALMRSFALSVPEVALHWEVDGQSVLSSPHDLFQTSESRVSAVLKPGFLKKTCRLEMEASGLQLTGWVSLPEVSSQNNNTQYFFINRRMVKDKVIGHAIRRAYAEYLPSGRHPLYVLYLTLAPDALDVNVHPTKHEVRFHEPRWVYDFLVNAIGQALQSSHNVVCDASHFPEIQKPLAQDSKQFLKAKSPLPDKPHASHAGSQPAPVPQPVTQAVHAPVDTSSEPQEPYVPANWLFKVHVLVQKEAELWETHNALWKVHSKTIWPALWAACWEEAFQNNQAERPCDASLCITAKQYAFYQEESSFWACLGVTVSEEGGQFVVKTWPACLKAIVPHDFFEALCQCEERKTWLAFDVFFQKSVSVLARVLPKPSSQAWFESLVDVLSLKRFETILAQNARRIVL